MRATRRKHIRALVEKLLASHNIQSPPVPVKDIILALNIEIRKQPTDDDLSGFLLRDSRARRVVIGVNGSHPPSRQTFTLAHELGHFLLHRGEEVHVDRNDLGFQVKLRSKGSSSMLSVEEKEANLFAAELLMPAKFLERDLFGETDPAGLGEKIDLHEERLLKRLAQRYQVSTHALTFRLANLEYIHL